MLKQKFAYLLWLLNGKSIPAPALVKQYFLYQALQKTHYRYLIETGTFNGDTVAALLPYFHKLDSVELSTELFERATQRFFNYPQVTIWQGDSGKVLKKILNNLKHPAIFWLDAHGSGGNTAEGEEWSPVIKELELITKHQIKKHLILIDDARGFTGNNSPTLAKLREIVLKHRPQSDFRVEFDVVHIQLR